MTDHAASDPPWRMKTHRPEELGTQEIRKDPHGWICYDCAAAVVNAGGKPLVELWGPNQTPHKDGEACSECGKTDTLVSYPLCYRPKNHGDSSTALGMTQGRPRPEKACSLERRRERVRLGDAAAPIADCEREQCGCAVCAKELADNRPQISQISADSRGARVWHMVLVPSIRDDDPAGVTVFCISQDENLVQREFDQQREKFPQGVIEKVKAVEAR